jgi:hypothetical protein
MGVTMLVCLTGHSALHATTRAEAMLEDPLAAPQCADASAGWPSDIAVDVGKAVVGLIMPSIASQRLPLAEALKALEATAQRHSIPDGIVEGQVTV